MTYSQQEKLRASAWKTHTSTLPDQAKVPAPYVDKEGRLGDRLYDFCLPPSFAQCSLLPEVRAEALELFAELAIPWHAGVGAGPSNHLVSSQVQCVNALTQMVGDPVRLKRAFGDLLGIDEVLQIEPGRYLTFEYIGPTDFFGESPTGDRIRGAHCTSVDAAFLHRDVLGVVELVLVEWKYTESYWVRNPDPAKDEIRLGRYGAAVTDPEGPVRDDVLAFGHLLDEPFYQLVRQQLLAWALERSGAEGASRVRIVHVLPTDNLPYQQSLAHPEHRALGNSVSEVWQRLLRRPDRFVSIDSKVFLDRDITSREYILRYSEDVFHDQQELLEFFGIDQINDLEEVLYEQELFDGDVQVEPQGIQLFIGKENLGLNYPFTRAELSEAIADLVAEAEEAFEADGEPE